MKPKIGESLRGRQSPIGKCFMKKVPDNDYQMMDSFKRGEEKGFNFFFREYYASLCYFSNSIIKDEAAAEDISTESFIKLWERCGEFESSNHVRAFLYKVVRNASIDWIRKNKKVQDYTKEQSYLGEISEASIQQHLIAAETYREVLASIERLPTKCRTIFKMIYLEGKDYTQIAKELGLSINTIRVQKARALAILRREPGITLLFLASFALSQ